MAQSPVTFIHHNGRVIPIRGQSPPGEKKPGVLEQHKKVAHAAVAATTSVVHKAKVHVEAGLDAVGVHLQPVKTNKKLDALAVGLSVASGVVGAATFSRGIKGFAGGLVLSHGLDALGVAANVASVAGTGQRKERVKQAARQEARNFVLGNVIFGAGILGSQRNRETLKTAIFKGSQKVFAVTSAVLKYGRKVPH